MTKHTFIAGQSIDAIYYPQKDGEPRHYVGVIDRVTVPKSTSSLMLVIKLNTPSEDGKPVYKSCYTANLEINSLE